MARQAHGHGPQQLLRVERGKNDASLTGQPFFHAGGLAAIQRLIQQHAAPTLGQADRCGDGRPTRAHRVVDRQASTAIGPAVHPQRAGVGCQWLDEAHGVDVVLVGLRHASVAPGRRRGSPWHPRRARAPRTPRCPSALRARRNPGPAALRRRPARATPRAGRLPGPATARPPPRRAWLRVHAAVPAVACAGRSRPRRLRARRPAGAVPRRPAPPRARPGPSPP